MRHDVFRRNGHAEPRPLAQPTGELAPPISWIRIPIGQPVDRRLRVLVYARYSTEEQNPRSIEAQVAYCERLLRALGITDYELIIIKDVEKSGELRERPGIDAVWNGTSERRWDLILAEDASRLYRHDSWAMDLVCLAVDNQVRVICINDSVDTADEQRVWIPRLKDATRTHAQTNQYTSDRIKRAHEDLWAQGAAIGLLRSGYQRRPTTPATEREAAKGPYYDEIDERWAPEIRAAFQQIANLDPPWMVALYLTEKQVPKTANSKLKEWTEETVKSLIRKTLYRGWDTFRITVSTKQLSTGKRKAQDAKSGQWLTRDMPQLRIVSDELWYQANAAIDDRRPCRDFPSGPENPLFGTPRDSRSLLTTLFKCGVCGAPIRGASQRAQPASSIALGILVPV
jgi:DNA invertase Pin-like site-specific DNA recombinase